MGVYYGKRENPCPRCGETVGTVFYSMLPMSFHQRCNGCKTEKYSEEEEKLLGYNQNDWDLEAAMEEINNAP